MVRDLEHLSLPLLDLTAPRRPRPGGGRYSPRDNPRAHGQRLDREARLVAGALVARSRAPILGINPRLVFRLVLHESMGLDDSTLAAMGLHVLSVDGSNRLVVFPDDETLGRLRTRLQTYAESGGDRFKYSNAFEAIQPLTPADRTGRRLRGSPLDVGEVAALDVELWHTGNRAQMLALVEEVRQALDGRAEVPDQYIGQALCLLRIAMPIEVLDELLELDHVKEIDRRPRPSYDIADVYRTTLPELTIGPLPDADASGIVVVDSGIRSGHPLLDGVVAESVEYASELGPDSGHGTWVAGVAAYGDLAEALSARRFERTVWLFSAKVTSIGDEYDPDRLVESQLRDLVEYFSSTYPGAKVFNLSLGDDSMPYVEGSLQFRLAGVIDELAYEYRDQEIVFVVSAGNQRPPDDEAAIANYPDYLFDDGKRVIDPATACLAITVGGVSFGEAAQLPLTIETSDRGIAQRGWPSAFTRTGPGHGGSIKPELVDFAGDSRFSRGRLVAPGRSGLPTTSHLFAPPTGELFRTVIGTSFAAPHVSHVAARLFDEFPGASSNLVRALLATSARVPDDRPDTMVGLASGRERILRAYGYGQASLERARASEANDALLVVDDEIEIDYVRLYEVPALPDNFRSARGRGTISVTLAFDPPTRHTRSRDYLGVRMQFALYRNVNPLQVYEAIRAWSSEERDDLDGDDVPGASMLASNAIHLEPGSRARNRGTLQRAETNVVTAGWRYDGEPLTLAVVCQRRWAPADVEAQRFAAVVEVRHENPEVDVYAALSVRARAFERVRIRA